MNISNEDILKFYNSEEYHALKAMELRDSNNLFDIIGKSRKEFVHTAMIAWILGNKEFKDLPEHPIIFLLRLFAINADSQKNDSNEGRDRFLEDNWWENIVTNEISLEPNSIIVETENNLNKDGIIDILLEGSVTINKNTNKIRIVIENKVDSREHDEQCKKYFEHYKNIHDGYTNFFIYLSIDSSESLSDIHFVKISYQEFLDNVLYPIMTYKESYSHKTYLYIEEYINTITSFKNQLAMSEKQKSLLKKLFDNNKDLITAAINAGDDEELKAAVQQAENNKEYKYMLTINGNEEYKGRPNEVARDVAHELYEKYKGNISKLIDDFGKLDNSGSIDDNSSFALAGGIERDFLIDTNSDITQKKKERTLDVDGLPENIKISNGWSRDKILSLKKRLEDKGIEEIIIEEVSPQ